jgi:hypothetical protein
VHAQQLELDHLHPAVAHQHLVAAGDRGRDAEELRLEHAGLGPARVERVQHHAGGAALRERHLLLVDEAALQREGEQHAEQRDHDHPDDHVPRGNDLLRDQHVGGERRDERLRHVARRGRDRLRAVVLEDREIRRDAGAGQPAVDREREDHRGEAHADADARLARDVERGGGEHAAQDEAGGRGAQGELRHVAAIHVLEPPAVLLLAGPRADLLIGEMQDGQRFLRLS